MDFDRMVERFVKLRDKITEIEKQHKEQLAPYKDAKERLEGILLEHLNAINASNVRTAHGTVSRKTKDSASIADMDLFWRWVQQENEYDMVDRKANVTAVREYIRAHDVPPPGVSFSSKLTVGVVRSNGKSE